MAGKRGMTWGMRVRKVRARVVERDRCKRVKETFMQPRHKFECGGRNETSYVSSVGSSFLRQRLPHLD